MLGIRPTQNHICTNQRDKIQLHNWIGTNYRPRQQRLRGIDLELASALATAQVARDLELARGLASVLVSVNLGTAKTSTHDRQTSCGIRLHCGAPCLDSLCSCLLHHIGIHCPKPADHKQYELRLVVSTYTVSHQLEFDQLVRPLNIRWNLDANTTRPIARCCENARASFLCIWLNLWYLHLNNHIHTPEDDATSGCIAGLAECGTWTLIGPQYHGQSIRHKCIEGRCDRGCCCKRHNPRIENLHL